ncbi:MAG: hypothetical protein P4L33_20405 [Capsulimonadaceae bacterium]|nr:hypothetical protein [Capsulimonadaceae bacterium]
METKIHTPITSIEAVAFYQDEGNCQHTMMATAFLMACAARVVVT